MFLSTKISNDLMTSNPHALFERFDQEVGLGNT
jgi:hypothetical protein